MTSSFPFGIGSNCPDQEELSFWVPLSSHVGVLFYSKCSVHKPQIGRNRAIDITSRTDNLNDMIGSTLMSNVTGKGLIIGAKQETVKSTYERCYKHNLISEHNP